MDLNDLRYFLAVAEELSIRKAAKRIHISQSTLSRKIMMLEDYYGVKAFIRDPVKLELTDEGKHLIKIALELLDTESRLFKYLENIKGTGIESLSLGVGPSLDNELILWLIDEFQKQNIHLNVTLRCGGARDLIKSVQRKELDILLTCALPDYFLLDGLENKILCCSRLTCIAPAETINHHLSDRDILTSHNFIHYRLGYQVRNLVDTFLGSQRIKVHSNFAIGEASGINVLVAHKKGIAITPYLNAYKRVYEHIFEEVKVKALDGYSIFFNAYYRQKAGKKPVVEEFVQYLYQKMTDICSAAPE